MRTSPNWLAGSPLRRTPLEEAYAAIDSFAATLGTDRNERLTLLATGLLQTINAERSQIIQGIERYARRQKELADKIKAERADLDALHAKQNPSEEQRARIKDLEKAFQWDTRVFESGGSPSPTCANRPCSWSSGFSRWPDTSWLFSNEDGAGTAHPSVLRARQARGPTATVIAESVHCSRSEWARRSRAGWR